MYRVTDCTFSATKNKDIGTKCLAKERRSVSTDGNRQRVESGQRDWFDIYHPVLKVDETCYCDLLLLQQLLSAKPQISGEFIFQQDMPQRTLHGSF